MWPYNDDEASWLTLPEPAKRLVRASVNDNNPARRRPRAGPDSPPAPAGKPQSRET